MFSFWKWREKGGDAGAGSEAPRRSSAGRTVWTPFPVGSAPVLGDLCLGLSYWAQGMSYIINVPHFRGRLQVAQHRAAKLCFTQPELWVRPSSSQGALPALGCWSHPAEGCPWEQHQSSSEASCPAKTNLLNASTAGSTDGRLPTRTIWGFCSQVSDLQSPALPIPGFFLWLEQLNPIFHSENWQLTLYQSTEM